MNFDPATFVQGLDPEQRAALAARVEQALAVKKLFAYKPNAKQMEFHACGPDYRERMFMAGNQLGKSLALAAEVSMHATGLYPEWWEGFRFNYAPRIMLGSESFDLFRDGLQTLMLGNPEDPDNWGTGFIPKRCLIRTNPKSGVANAVDSIVVKHVSASHTGIKVKSYEQGRRKVQAMTLDFVGLDEEPPEDFYMECLTRLNHGDKGRGGRLAIVFTPLLGMSKVVSRFIQEKPPGTRTINMTIDDAEHYSEDRKKEIIAQYPEHQRDARIRGIPMMGSGLVYPVPEASIRIDPIPIPDSFVHIGAFDFGGSGPDGHPTAAVKIAWDRDNDVYYVTNVYRKSGEVTAIHAAAVRPWGDWLPFSWPHDGLQHDRNSGEQLAESYRMAGVKMLPERATFIDGTNGVEAGIDFIYEAMLTGRWKVFSTCPEFFDEMRLYHRVDGKLIKLNDDILSAARYAIMMRRFAVKKPKKGDAWIPKTTWA